MLSLTSWWAQDAICKFGASFCSQSRVINIAIQGNKLMQVLCLAATCMTA